MAKTYQLIGKDFTPSDLLGKVTGAAKFAEDFRVEGMLFAKLLMSPMPHAKVRRIDASKAMAMPGVIAMLTADDVPQAPAPMEPMLTNEPLYAGEPILAVAAVDELTAAEAIEQINVEFEPLPFVIDPLDSLRPRGPDARAGGNVANVRLPLQTLKWEAKDFAAAGEDRLPMGKPAEEWQYGDLEAGFEQADLVLEETFVTQAMTHHPMEPRSALAYWQNGKLFLHGSSQSGSFIVPRLAKLMGLPPSQVVLIAENCGGGFGSKAVEYPQWGIPALLAKKANRPVLLRVTREEEYCFGRSRAGFQGWVKIGFRQDGRITAMDLYVVHSNGPYAGFWDFRNAGKAASIVYQPLAMRWRGVSVLTNTPPRSAQRGPGENQTAAALEPFLDKAARQLGLDRVAIRRINAPDHNGKVGAKQESITSSYLREALDQGAARFKWAEKVKQSGKRTGPHGNKVVGVGVGTAFHQAGFNGFDGLLVIKPDGKLYIHNGTGNLGTYSYAATARAAAEALGMPWERCEVVFGDSSRNLPWNIGQFGSNTSFTMVRTNHVAAMDAKQKLQEIAAAELGGDAAQYEVGNERVYLNSNPEQGLSMAQAAERAIRMGGKYSGAELPDNLNPLTAQAAKGLAGQGLVGVAKDTLAKKGLVPGFCAAFVRVEVDVETGHVAITDCVGVADCGTVIHPQSMATQIKGGAVQGFGMALGERHFFDPKFGLSGSRGLYASRIPTYLDGPLEMQAEAVNQPDPYSPIGSKGLGEPPLGAAASAVVCAVADALGGTYFNRIPVSADMILNAVEGRPQSYKPLEVNI